MVRSRRVHGPLALLISYGVLASLSISCLRSTFLTPHLSGKLGHLRGRISTRMRSGEAAAVTGRKLEEFQVGDELEATVDAKNRAGTFLDIDAEKNALLKAPVRLCRKLKIGERIKTKVEYLDLEKRQIGLVCPDLEAMVASRPDPLKSVKVNPKLEKGTNNVTISNLGNISKVNVDYENGVVKITLSASASPEDSEIVEALKGMAVGQTVSGKVLHKNRAGVWIEIGAPLRPKLNVAPEIGDKLKFGEELPKLTISEIDIAQRQFSVELDGAEELVAGRERNKLADLQEGSVQVGHVATANRYGVFVDIDYETDAKLQGKASTLYQYEQGQEVKIKVLAIDREKQRIEAELAE